MSRPYSALFLSAILSRRSDEHRHVWRADGVSKAIGYAKFRSRSHDAVIRVYDAAGDVIETPGRPGPILTRACVRRVLVSLPGASYF
jgi:hypothetical protein